jgi:RNA polymerase sigma-70 factor (ECF subfamily)
MQLRNRREFSKSKTRSLVESVQAGNRERFGDLYHRVVPSVYAWASLKLRGSLGRYVQPEDFVQEVWLRALVAFPRFDPEATPFRRWIYGIVHNVLREALRAAARQPRQVGGAGPSDSRLFDLDDLPAEITSLSLRVARDEGIKTFMKRIEALDPADRELVRLRGLEGLPFKDIARIQRVNEETARKKWQRLRTKLAVSGLPEGLLDEGA